MPIIVTPGTLPPVAQQVVNSTDGTLRAYVHSLDWGGILLRADYHTLNPLPQQVRFYRQSDNNALIPVRTGDAAWAPGGIAFAFEHEAPLGASATWLAAPIINGVEQATTAGVSVLMPEPAGGVADPGTWFKSLENPELSMQVKVQAWPSLTYASRSVANSVLGSTRPTAVGMLRSGATSQITILTFTLDERQQFLDLIAGGSMILTQSKTAYGREDRYWLFGDVTEGRPATLADSPLRTFQIDAIEVDAPDTGDQPLRVPTRSYADRLAAYATYQSVISTGRTYEQALTG